jgi:hypothetical protein
MMCGDLKGFMGSGTQPSDGRSAKQTSGGAPETESEAPEPQWADGLRKLYDSVVEEPLPDSFKDLLAKLDDDQGSGG